MQETLQFGLVFSIIGIAIVFAVLALIAVGVALMRRLDTHWEQREAKELSEAYEKTPSIDDLTLVLISAAAATMVAGRFRITQVRRLPRLTPQPGHWSRQGRAVLHGSHVRSVKR